jgi:hypothetical protein
MRGSKTERADNFERRLKETVGSELEPEMVTPNTAGEEELPYEETFPIVRQFNQTNMKPGGRRSGKQQDGDGNQG